MARVGNTKRLFLMLTLLDSFHPEHAHFFAFFHQPFGGAIHTFVATSALPVLYFDGMSAAKVVSGPMDLQNAIVYGNDSTRWSAKFSDEIARSEQLCEWVTGLGYGGIVREEATFEVIWVRVKSNTIKVGELMSLSSVTLPKMSSM